MMTPESPKSLLKPEYEPFIAIVAAHLLGSKQLWLIDTDSDEFDIEYKEDYLKKNNGSRLVQKALHAFKQNNELSYAQMVSKMEEAIRYTLANYNFGSQEKLYVSSKFEDGLQVGNGYDFKKLARAGIRPESSVWMLESKLLDSFDFAGANNNFFASVYSNFFNVPSEIKSHLNIAMPNIGFPHHLREAYYYLKFLRMPKMHDANQCLQAINIYNKSVETSSYDFKIYFSDEIYSGITREVEHNKYAEALLLMLLTYSCSCTSDELIWANINYDHIFSIFLKTIQYKRDDGTKINSRIINSDYYKDMLHIAHFMIQNTLREDGVTHKQADMLKLESFMSGTELIVPEKVEFKQIDDEKIIDFLASNISSDNWSDWGALPSSWLALL